MKKVYSAIASLALLLSLPALAAPLAQKAVNSKGKNARNQTRKDSVRAPKTAPRTAESPIFRGGGGAKIV